MKKQLTRFISQLNPRKMIFIITFIVIFHAVFMLYLAQSARTAQQTAKRDTLFQKIINVIHLLEATPQKNRQAAVSALADPDIHVVLSDQPLWPMQFRHASFWDIVHRLESNLQGFSVSIQLNDQEWLNIHATVYSHLLAKQLLFLLIEVVVFGSILISLWSINRFTRPLKTIKLSAERLGIDLETKPLAIYGPPVVREVSHALNQMQARILQLIRNRTLMLAAISHDLRTPIMRARLRLQFIKNSQHKEKLLSDLEEMETMIHDTLVFAREESQSEKKAIDLVSLVRSICDDAIDCGHQVIFHEKSKRIVFHGKPIALKRAFSNLIYNAIRYAGSAEVTLLQKGQHIFIRVEDNGPGIPEADLPKIFEPFYRVDTCRSRETGGVGLGLAITHDIIRAHHGKISIKNKKSGGLQVLIKLHLGMYKDNRYTI